jgi:periplasmic protein TonB
MSGSGAGRLASALLSATVSTIVLVAAPGAEAAGKPSLQAYFQATLQDASYQKKVFDGVAKAWKRPEASAFPRAGAKAVVQAVISRDGRIVSTLVSTSSGSKGWDAAARKAVEDAAPFDPFPGSAKLKTVEVHFHFSVVP